MIAILFTAEQILKLRLVLTLAEKRQEYGAS